MRYIRHISRQSAGTGKFTSYKINIKIGFCILQELAIRTALLLSNRWEMNAMTKISVSDMMCEKCVQSITNKLNELGLTFTVSLSDKTVTIDGCENCVKKAVDALDAIGFTPEVL